MSFSSDPGLVVTQAPRSSDVLANLDKVGNDLWRGVSEQFHDTQAKGGVKVITAEVVSVDAERKVTVRRPENASADGQAYPVLAPAYLPKPGDWVTGFELDGGVWIMGRRSGAIDRDIPDLVQNKLERDASQSVVPPPGSFMQIDKKEQLAAGDKIALEIKKDFATGPSETAIRFVQHDRYWSRLGANELGMHAKTGDPNLEAFVNFRAADLIADNGATLKDTRVRADNANANADIRLKRDATEQIIPAVGKHLIINKGPNSEKIMMELFKDQAGGVLETAIRWHQNQRYWYRLAADTKGMHLKVGDPADNSYRMLYVEDLVTDNNVGVKNNRIRADNAQIRADDAWHLANGKVGQHTHFYTRTNWSTDANGYMFNGFWEDILTSGIVL